MKKSKKLVIAIALAAAIVAGSLGGVVLAADNGDETESPARMKVMLDKVAANYFELTGDELDIEALKNAFGQARDDMRTEALQDRLDKLVEDGVITQDEADEWSSWWALKPDASAGFGLRGHGRFLGMGGPCSPMR
jgi:hypothetical protein